MTQLEKKFSDFQKDECDTQIVEQPIDERLCPDCYPDPNFKLPEKWYLIKESYLNEEFCEYHVRIYRKYLDEPNEEVIKRGVERLLIDLDKALNDENRKSLERVAIIVKTNYDQTSKETNEACLVAVPSFNFNAIPDLDDEDGEQGDQGPTIRPEAEVNYRGLFKKMIQLGGALRVYGLFYANAQNLKSTGLKILYKDNPAQRVNYSAIRKQLKNFRFDLNLVLRQNNYEGIDYPSLIKRKYEKIKFVYREDKPFVIKNIYVLDENCNDKYTKLKINKEHDLFKEKYITANAFMANIEQVIIDITAQETKPWLEFTIDNVYPPVVVDYGSLESFDEGDYNELGCLLEKSLGIGNGQVTDYLAKETLSFFKTLENEAYKSACRSINDIAAGGQDAKNLEREKTQYEERKERQVANYKRQYINDMTQKTIELANAIGGFTPIYDSQGNAMEDPNRYTKDNVFSFVSNRSVPTAIKEPEYSFKNDKGIKTPGGGGVASFNSEQQLNVKASLYAETKFENLDIAWGSRFKNNADWEEMKESYSEVFNGENSFLDYVLGKEPGDSDKPPPTDSKILNTIGLCGMTKMTGKMLKCLLGGVTIEEFYDLMIQKTLEFMSMNTFNLFLNNLPSGFLDDLNSEIEAQFGGVSFTDLINMKTQESAKISDICDFNSKDRIMKIFERYPDPLKDPNITAADKEFIKNNIGDAEFYKTIMESYSFLYNRETSGYNQTDWPKELVSPSTAGSTNKKKEYKTAKKYLKKVVKHARRSYLKGSDTFAQANNKVKKTKENVDEYLSERKEEDINAFDRANKNLQQTNMGVKVDAVYDVVFDFAIDYIADSLQADFLIEQLSNFPGADLAVGFITDFFKSCPHPPLFDPPAGDFMKSFSLDVCDPELTLSIPKINFPSLSLRYNIDKQFGEIFRNAIVELISKIAINLLKKVLAFLGDALCKALQAIGTPLQAIATGVEQGNLVSGFKNNFEKALDELFCGGSTNPETGNSRASELANGLFMPALAQSSEDYVGAGDRVSNIISSVLSQNEILEAVVSGSDQANKLVANAIDALSPEMRVLLGSPDQVAIFFDNLRSYLPSEDQQRIRDLLDAGVPNLPLTASICLTNDQLKAWNDLRNGLLQDMGLTPEQAAEKVNKLNEEVLDELEKTIGDALELENPDGPFIGAITSEALKDACDPKNKFNDVSDNDLSKEEAMQINDQQFNILLRLMMISFNGRNGVFGNALRDKLNNREGAFRRFLKFFNPNYSNKQTERDAKYETRGVLGKALMSALTDASGSVQGDFPETVGIYLRDQLLGGLTFNLPTGFSTVYEEEPGEASHYKARHRFVNLDRKKDFSYEFRFVDRLGSNQAINENYVLPIEVLPTQKEMNHLENIGITPQTSDSPLRENIFSSYASSIIPLNKDFGSLQNKIFESLGKKITEASVTNENNPLDLPSGFLFGYVTSSISEQDFEYLNKDGSPYDKEESEQVLGKYGHTRIRVLNPEVYGGRYSNPPYTIQPRKFQGWVEYAMNAFESRDGCDPERPPMLSLLDIKSRVDYLENTIRNYPEMTKDKDCVVEKPFKLLINNKSRARMDGTVRSTLRIYIAEYFLKGIGVFSNVHFRPENFDPSFSAYITKKMKDEMFEIGNPIFPRRKSIAQSKYWYTFLEQCVQSYQTMFDLNEVKPPPAVLDALEKISEAQMLYPKIDRSTKKTMKSIVGNLQNRPSIDNRLETISKPAVLAIYGMDFRLADDKDAYFSSGAIDSRVNIGLIRRSSVKKLKFFAKILAIRMFEEEAMVVMNELVRFEAARLSETAFDGLSDKPLIYDIKKALIGLGSVFQGSTSNIGLNSYYLAKQEGTADPGTIPDVVESSIISPLVAGGEVQFIVEKYVRTNAKSSANLSLPNGVNPTTSFQSLISQLRSSFPNNSLSDYFGNLKFTYKGSFKALMDKGFNNNESIQRLHELNRGTDVNIALLQNSLRSYVGSRDFEDFQVIYDDSFLDENENPSPFGTTGSLEISYGVRISCVLPADFLSAQDKLTLLSELGPISSQEKCFMFQNGTFILPLVQTEVEAVDSSLSEYSVTQKFDLECIVNKMVESPQFTIMFDKVFPVTMFTSSSAIFCTENFMKSMGRGEGERIPEIQELIKDQDDDWEGVMNEFVKNYIRRQFASTYLSNDIDGFSLEQLTGRERQRLFGSFNPFDVFSLPSIKIPWFRKRRLKLKVLDAEGNECANPEKDFE